MAAGGCSIGESSYDERLSKQRSVEQGAFPGLLHTYVPYYLAKWNLRGTILCYIISQIFAAPIPYRIKNWDIWYQKPRTFCMRNWYFLPLTARNPTYLATCNPFVVITKDLKDSQFSGEDGH